MNKQKDLNKDKSLEDNDDIKSSSTSSSDYEKYVRLGESIGDAITSKWNSQKNLAKYISRIDASTMAKLERQWV